MINFCVHTKKLKLQRKMTLLYKKKTVFKTESIAFFDFIRDLAKTIEIAINTQRDFVYEIGEMRV